jgi:hypothetical protein
MADFSTLKRKRATLHSNVTKFSAAINNSADATTLEDLEHYRGRLQETLDRLVSLDDSIHDLLNNKEYAADVDICETYIDTSKRAIYKAARAIDSKLSTSVSSINLASTSLPL